MKDAPRTKSTQLIGMVNDLKDIIGLHEEKTDTIKQYTKQIKEELEESFEVKKHEEETSKKLKEILDKNEDLVTKANEVIRLDDKTVLWIEKTYANITELDKLPPEEKGQYDLMKKEIEDKKKIMDEMTKKVTRVSDIVSEIRLVVMPHAMKVLKSAVTEDRLDLVLAQYDEANSLLDDVMSGIRSVLNSIIGWLKNILN